MTGRMLRTDMRLRQFAGALIYFGCLGRFFRRRAVASWSNSLPAPCIMIEITQVQMGTPLPAGPPELR